MRGLRRLIEAWKRRTRPAPRALESWIEPGGLHSRTDRVNEAMVGIERAHSGFGGRHVR